MMIDWTRLPWLVLTLLAIGLWLWRSRGGIPQSVSSTEIWQRLAPSTVRRPLAPLIVALLLAAAAAAPVLTSSPDNFDLQFNRDDEERLHLEVRAGSDDAGTPVTVSNAAGTIAETSLEFATGASVLTVEVEGALPGEILEVTIGSRIRRLTVPLLYRPRVVDLSQLAAVGDGLAALEEAGRIEIVTGGGDIAFLRGEGEAPAALAVRFPPASALSSRILVGPDGQLPPSPLLDGLRWRAWTILEAMALAGGETLIAGDDGQPLLVIDEDGARFAFDPANSNIPARAGWPVLLGRLIEELTVTPAPSQERWRGLLPALLAIAAGLLCLALASGLRTTEILLVIAASLLWPLLSPPPPVPLDGDGKVSILEAVRSLAAGSTLAIDSSRPLPAAGSTLARRLRQGGIAIVIVEGPVGTITASPARVLPGQPVEIATTGLNPAVPIEVWQQKASVDQLGSAPLTWIPTRAGIAFIRPAGGGQGTTVIVENPIASAILAPAPEAAQALLPSPIFEEVPSDGGLPRPPRGSVVIWNGTPISASESQQLRSWLEEGGTMLAVAAPPFLDRSLHRQLLDRLLPAPLPPPPLPPEEDHGILLLDLSGSLTGDGARTLLAGTVSLLEGTPAGGRWGILGFRESTSWLVPPGTPIDGSIIDGVRERVRSGGGTRLGPALEVALASLSGEQRGRALVVVSDGRSEPADWQGIGAALEAAHVRLSFVAVGESVNSAVIESLCGAAGGSWHRASGPRQAVSLLGEAVNPRRGSYEAVTGELRPASLDPLLDGSPVRLPGPARRIAVSTPHPVSRTLWVDEAGQPLLLGRSIGAGTSLLWLGGIDDESLGGGASLIRDALSTMLLDAARSTVVASGKSVWTIDESGAPALLIDREAGSPARRNYTLSAPGMSAETRVDGALLPARGRLIPIETAAAAGWIAEDEEGRKIAAAMPVAGEMGSWKRWLRREELAERGFPAPHPWLLLFALVLVLTPAARQQPSESAVGSGPARG